jgi:superfamily II DNA or RNA helicase
MAGISFDLGHARPGPLLEPRQWQRQLIQLLRARLGQPSPRGHDVLIHAGPGAGKTLGALLGVERLQRDGHLDRFVVFCHRTAIAGQWQRAAQRLGLELREWQPSQRQALAEAGAACGLLLSYQAAALHRPLLQELILGWGPQRWLAIADEVHHLGLDPEEPEAAAWGHAFSALTGSAALRLGLTGTPFRADQLAFCAARRLRVRDGDMVVERIVPDLCVEPRQLIAAGDVRPLEFRFQDGWVDHARSSDGAVERSPLSAEARESWRARNLRRAIQLADGSSIALQLLLKARRRLELVRHSHPEAGGLVIARDIAHARRLAALLQEQGDRVLLVHSLDPEAAAHLRAFQAGDADWLVSIDMCSEGFDAPRLRVVAYLSTVVTRSRFVQAITRAVRLDGERGTGEPIPRHPSYVFAPADPLLIRHARSWSLSEPYLLRSNLSAAAEPVDPGGWGPSQPAPAAIADGAGAVLAMGGPELPAFLSAAAPRRSA